MIVEDELNRKFWGGMPREYMQSAVALLDESYVEAARVCTDILKLADPEIDNTWWSIRRALIEGGLRKIAVPSVDTEVVLGREAYQPHPWNHTVVHAGNVMMTQICVQHYDQRIAISNARDSYAKPNEERFLFDYMAPEKSQTSAKPLYAVLIHGKAAKARELGFAYIRFPKPAITGAETLEWYPGMIDLLTVLRSKRVAPPDLVPEEPVGDPPMPEIKRQDDVV